MVNVFKMKELIQLNALNVTMATSKTGYSILVIKLMVVIRTVTNARKVMNVSHVMMGTSCMIIFVISKSKIAHKTVQSALSKTEQFCVMNVTAVTTLINYLIRVTEQVCVISSVKHVLKENVVNVNKGILRKIWEHAIESLVNARRTA